MSRNWLESLKAWETLLGDNYVIVEEELLAAAETATYATTQKVPAIIRPANRAEVQECVKIANQYQIPIYPISTGKNWGYGSRVPVQDGSVLLDLGRLNRIVDYNEKLAYVTVEPGVTQRQLFEFLREQKSNLWMSITGSSADSSLIGNTVERGVAKGPLGDRFAHVCAFEVVLPNGDCVHTGFSRFSNAKTTPLNRWGVGPFLDGLFTQSNLGIVTQMTMWLMPKPNYYQYFWYTLDDESQLENLIERLRQLRLTEQLRTTFVVSNDYRTISYISQYPWQEAESQTPLPAGLRDKLRVQGEVGRWFGEGALYSASEEQGRIERRLIQQALEKSTATLHFLDDAISKQPEEQLQELFPNTDLDEIIKWYDENPHRGVPTEMGLLMSYWRKKEPWPAQMDPDRDHCGLIWVVPSIPFEGRAVREAVTIVEKTALAYQYEPSIGFNCVTARNIDMTNAIVYDREVEGEDERAQACADEMVSRFMQAGYYPYRLNTHQMTILPPAQDDYGKLLRTLKHALDPNNILAPGRYDFRQEWPKEALSNRKEK